MEYLPYIFCGTLIMEDCKPKLRKYCHILSCLACCVCFSSYYLHPSTVGMTIVQQAVVTLGWQMYWYKQLPYMEIIPYHLVIPLFLVLLDHDALSWWKIGECKDVWLWISTLLLCLITVAVLIFWSITVGGNHGHMQDILGEVMLSWRGVFFFSFWNAAVEEIEFRGFYLEALLNGKLKYYWLAILVQAITFGLMHYRNGFPSGLDGLTYTTLWAIVLAILRICSGGMIHPFLVHVVADFTIGILIRNKEQALIKERKDGFYQALEMQKKRSAPKYRKKKKKRWHK